MGFANRFSRHSMPAHNGILTDSEMMITIEKTLLLALTSGFSPGVVWRRLLDDAAPEAGVEKWNSLLLEGREVSHMRQIAAQRIEPVASHLASLGELANGWMDKGPWSVTSKVDVPDGFDPHDYLSLAKYWWPNADAPDGLPYVRRDGEVNPDCYLLKYDLTSFSEFSEAVFVLSLSAALNRIEEHGQRAIKLLEAWFVDPETCQNPNFDHAQIVPGIKGTKWWGVVEARRLVYVLEAVALLRADFAFSRTLESGLQDWFRRFVDWLEKSENGVRACSAVNNIGLWYDLLRVSCFWFLDEKIRVEEILVESSLRIGRQVASDGEQQEETKRAKPYEYLVFSLTAMAGLAAAGERVGVPIWESLVSEGQSCAAALDWLRSLPEGFALNFGMADIGAASTSLDGDGILLLGLMDRVNEARRKRIESLQDENQKLSLLLENGRLKSEKEDARLLAQSEKAEVRALEATAALKEVRKHEAESHRVRLEAEQRAGIAEARIAIAEDESKRDRERIEELKVDLTESRKREESVAREKAELAERMAGAEARIEELEQKTGGLKQRLEEAKSKLAERQSKINELKKKRDEYKLMSSMRLSAREKTIEQLQQRIKALHQSKSWKVTAPVRWMIWKAGRVVHGGNERLDRVDESSKDVFSVSSLPYSSNEHQDPVGKKTESTPLVSADKDPEAKAMIDKEKEQKSAKKKILKEAIHPVELIRQSVPKDVESLKAEYHAKGLHQVEDTFVFCRILGNDLYPRHKLGQTRENLEFMLKHEPEYPGCRRLWVLNRVFDEGEKESIIELLQSHKQEYLDIPFEEEAYRRITFDTDSLPAAGYLSSDEYASLGVLQRDRVLAAACRLKNNYVMNNNGARNFALRAGKKLGKWVMPWDGNCYLTPSAYAKIREEVLNAPWIKFFVVPMARMLENETLLLDGIPPDPVEEPQLIFRQDSEAEFNEDFCYGRRPKVELFWALGIPGKWDSWKDDPWDLSRRSLLPEAGQFGVAGWVARLYSGMGNLEADTIESFKNRGRVRQEAIIETLRYLDRRVAAKDDRSSHGAFVSASDFAGAGSTSECNTHRNYFSRLMEEAEIALQRGLYSVVDKTTLPPSGDPQDYWHPAPYWWPDPTKSDGLPYIKKDGIRVPGTLMYEPESEKYDRTRIQRVFDDSLTLVLAGVRSGDSRYPEHACAILKRFFVDPETRMNPHLFYSQVRMGRNKSIGFSSGIIEFKDLYYYLDAVRVLEHGNYLSEADASSFREWMGQYLDWLLTSKQGIKERIATNNHGTYYDLQVGSIAAYLGQEDILYQTLARAQGRIDQQITPIGIQPEEMSRPTSAHYCCFNLQGFLHVAMLGRRFGVDLWGFESMSGSSIRNAVDWLLAHHGKEWPYEQIEAFDAERFYPLYHTARCLGYSELDGFPDTSGMLAIKPCFFPHDGIMPWWALAQR